VLVAITAAQPSFAQTFITVQDALPGCQQALQLEENAPYPVLLDVVECASTAASLSTVMHLNCVYRTEGYVTHPNLSAGNPPSSLAAIQAFVNWAQDNPAAWDMDFRHAMIFVISGEFPCSF
jgi:hypothetical protein